MGFQFVLFKNQTYTKSQFRQKILKLQSQDLRRKGTQELTTLGSLRNYLTLQPHLLSNLQKHQLLKAKVNKS